VTTSRSAATPLYEQARQTVLELIADGTYRPGDRLPSESALAERLGVHRLTARRALEELAREGVVVARKGSGTYVAPRHEPLPISVPLTRAAYGPSLRRELTAAGRQFRDVLLDVVRGATPGPDVPPELRAAGALTMVRDALEVDGEFWVYTRSWLPSARVRRIRRSWRQEDGLYGVVLDQAGDLASAWRAFLAEPASGEVAEVLGVRPGAPVLVREGLTHDAAGRPLLYVRRHARGDRVRYVLAYSDPGS
jgi:GntR family transcriptional regulator